MGFNTSLSGINAANADLNVTANNIANVKTIGFKQSRAEFADLVNSSHYGLSKNTIGTGVNLSQVAQQFSPGPIDPTGNKLDLAISGNGFFTLSMNGSRVYSRAGNFQKDLDGYIINPQGARLQAFAPSADGSRFEGRLADLQLLSSDSPPKQSTLLNVGFTLPGNAKQPVTSIFDPKDSSSYNHASTGIQIYDSLGVSHTQTSYFVKTANPNEWEVHNFIDGQSSGAPVTLQFSDNGQLIAPQPAKITLDPFTPATGAGVVNLSIDISGARQYGEKFATHQIQQDGYAAGKFDEFEISKQGIVFAHYSNGAKQVLGQVALTTFNNLQGLVAQGNNLWSQSHASGDARTGAPQSSDLGQIEQSALEASNVDLTEQLVNMIVAQRNFQANAQAVSVQDQLTQTVINIR